MSRHALLLALVLASTSCGTEPSGQQTTTLKGVVLEYVSGGAMPGVTVTLLEDPTKTTTSDNNGEFQFTQLTPGSSVRILTSTTNYPEATNQVTFLGAGTLNVTARAVSVVFVGSQYGTTNVARVPNDAMIVARLEDDRGAPRTGMDVADITLLDQNQAPSGTGPFVLGANGNADTMLTVTTAFGGRSRIVFLNVPPGDYTLKVIDGSETLLRPLVARDSGTTLVVR